MSGKIIVIDGGDGAGKATQVQLLAKRLEREGVIVETLDFPNYDQNTFGKLIRECLDGKRGDFMAVDPRIASTLYAADRFESKPKIERWLAEGKTVILDRYVSANMMHQGAKIADQESLEAFLGWLDHMEHEVFGLPRPDMIIYLAQAVTEQKHKVGKDLAEINTEHQENTEARARKIIKLRNNWHQVTCTEGDEMRSRESIHEEIYKLVAGKE